MLYELAEQAAERVVARRLRGRPTVRFGTVADAAVPTVLLDGDDTAVPVSARLASASLSVSDRVVLVQSRSSLLILGVLV